MIQNLAERKFGSGCQQKKNKPQVEHEPRSAHGRTVNKKNKPRVNLELRSAHGRAVKK